MYFIQLIFIQTLEHYFCTQYAIRVFSKNGYKFHVILRVMFLELD